MIVCAWRVSERLTAHLESEGAGRSRARPARSRAWHAQDLGVCHRDGEVRPSSRRPSRSITRSATAAASRSWVTSSTAAPRSWATARSRRTTRGCGRCRGCRSARQRASGAGSPASARAIDTRWRSPLESCSGVRAGRSPRPTRSSHGRAPRLGLAHRHAAEHQLHRGVLERRDARHELRALVDEARRPDTGSRAACAVGQRGDLPSREADRARFRREQRGDQQQQRRLARAAGAVQGRASRPGRTHRLTPSTARTCSPAVR